MPPKYMSKKRVNAESDDDATSSKRVKTLSTKPMNDGEGKYWELSKNRRVNISEFNGKQLINIREYYEKDGKSLPGKKGISMTIEQYSALINIMPQLESELTAKGESVPRPSFDGQIAAKESGSEGEEEEDVKDETDEDVKPKMSKKDKTKKNHDLTSDEE